jgi:hypothetical protein
MFHFAQFQIEATTPEATEEAVRHFSSKRQTSLDLKSSGAIPGETKYFMGLEDQDKLQITRFRFLIERLMPKLIVTFRKSEQFLRYSVRLSLPAFVLLLLFVSVGLYNLFDCLFRGDEEGAVTSMVIILLIPVLTFIELFLTRRRIHQAIANKS